MLVLSVAIDSWVSRFKVTLNKNVFIYHSSHQGEITFNKINFNPLYFLITSSKLLFYLN